jgi:ATP synthase protein I
VRRAERRHDQAERDRPTLFVQTTYLGTLGILLALPIVAGAYLGEWLDRHLRGFSVSWTITGILLGVALGAFSAYWFVKERA